MAQNVIRLNPLQNGVGTDNATCKIITVDLVQPVGATSFKKLRNVFSNETNGGILSKKSYGFIYENLGQKLFQKYRVKNIKFI